MTGPGRRGDDGLSLVELLVTMVIAGIVLPLVFGVLINAQRSTASTMATSDSVGEAQRALATIDRQVRSGTAPIYVSGTQAFGFYSKFAANGAPIDPALCVQYRVSPDDGDNIEEPGERELQARTFPVTSAPPAWTSTSVRRVISGVTSTTTFTAVPDTAVPSTLRSVRVTLDASRGSGRPASIDGLLTTRNTTTASTTPCSVLS